MKRNKKNINRDLVNRKYFIKYELKKLILRSIIQNKNIKPIIRSYAMFKKTMLPNKNSISKQKNVCLLRGRNKGVWKFSQLSRHATLKLATNGFLQNTKVCSW